MFKCFWILLFECLYIWNAWLARTIEELRACREFCYMPTIRLTGYSTDPVAYVVVPLDNFVYVLFLLLAILLLNSVCFDSREAHIFWGTTMQFALFLLLREVCFVVLDYLI